MSGQFIAKFVNTLLTNWPTRLLTGFGPVIALCQ